ncbi:MAG TPA: proprotein convertase P-domain protein, partial [Actinomycetota bacterium]
TDMGTKDIPNRNEGWGRVNVGALFDPAEQRMYVDQSVVLDEIGAEHAVNVTPADPSKPMKVTVAWSDAPGAPGANPALVNDLDLSVTSADGLTVYNGNRFVQGVSAAGGFPDRVNNVENVFIPTPSGAYRVAVSAFNLPGDGIPFAGDETDQDFALVISNAVLAT